MVSGFTRGRVLFRRPAACELALVRPADNRRAHHRDGLASPNAFRDTVILG